VLRLINLTNVPSRTPDEVTYTAQSRRILKFGIGQVPAMVREYDNDQRLALYPSPIRIGWDVPLAGVMGVTGITDERAGAGFSTFLSVATFALLGFLGYRYLPPQAALYAVVFFALSTFDLTLARRSWQDSMMGFLGLLLVWFTAEILRNPSRRWPYAGLVATGSYFVLVKELGGFVYITCVAFVMLFLIRRRDWRTVIALSAAGFAGAAISVVCLVTAAGGVTPLLTVWQHLNEATYTNPYCVYYQGGPWYLSLWGLWILSPINLVLWILAAGCSLLPAGQLEELLELTGEQIAFYRLVSWMSVMLVVTILVLPNSQSFRFLAPVYGPMYLMGGVGVCVLASLVPGSLPSMAGKVAYIAIAALALAGAVGEYRHFVRVFVGQNIPDLAVKYVIDSRN